jgi:segregation and condensation protein A
VSHSVKLDVFEGPIDLLLHLITRQRLDIYEVPLAAIARDYVEALETLDELDLEAATGFLVVAASLLELKSARLLPSPESDAEATSALDERDLLLARLVECATYRAAGEWIARLLEHGADRHGRTAGLEARYADLVPDLVEGMTIEHVGLAAARALVPRPLPEVDVGHLAPINASVRDAIASVAERLETVPRLTFRELCSSLGRRIDVVVRFLALLELFKAGAVELRQEEPFGDISARWTGRVAAREVLSEVDEYDSVRSRTR